MIFIRLSSEGSKAKFETNEEIVELEVFTQQFSDYLDLVKSKGFELLELNEWFDNKK